MPHSDIVACCKPVRSLDEAHASAYADLGVRDAEITAHAAFRKRLYDHDVVPEALEAATALVRSPGATAS
jgi:salicylate hydroxylase